MKYNNNSSFYKGEFVKNNMREMNKRGQVTMFIIIAIVLVAIILFFYFYLYPKIISSSDNRPLFDRCIQDEVKKEIVDLAPNTGLLISKFNTMYMDKNISFACYTNEYYKPCVVLHPFLKNDFEDSLATMLKPQIQTCYDKAVDDLVARGKEVTAGTIKSNVTIDMNGVKVSVLAPTTISSGESATSFTKPIDVYYYSNIYTILMVANSILQFESSYGDSDTSSFMYYYPDLNVQKISREDSVKIYIITDKKDIKYQFATRSYAWPAGYAIQQ